MIEKSKFVGLVKGAVMSMTEACARFGISRKTGYKWLGRFEERGPLGLEEHSRAPKRTPWAIQEPLRSRILALRKRRPTWGPRKLLASLRRERPLEKLPAASSVGELLKREGLIDTRRRQRNARPPPAGLCEPVGPNDCWCVDFKGHFPIRTGICYPLTVTDAFSRALLGCDALTSQGTHLVMPVFKRLFEEYGVPAAIRSDNGTPFASTGLGGLSRLSAWWIRLGIRLERIPPGKPQYNGRHERMHRVLNAETVSPQAHSMNEQQHRFDDFIDYFNTERPHEAIGNEVPSKLYQPSVREFPRVLPELEYPHHFEVRHVKADGTLQFLGQSTYASVAVRCQTVGLEQFGDGLWNLYFGNWPLGVVDGRRKRIRILAASSRPPALGFASLRRGDATDLQHLKEV
jgi:transposase InsO family protein